MGGYLLTAIKLLGRESYRRVETPYLKPSSSLKGPLEPHIIPYKGALTMDSVLLCEATTSRGKKQHVNTRILQTMVSDSHLSCASEPEYRILMFMSALGPWL